MTHPQQPTDVPAVQEAAVPPVGRWPWGVTAVVALVALVGFGVAVWLGWRYVVTHDETAEQADWDQLLGLIDRVDSLSTLILGALLGAAVGAAKQATDTTKAAAAAAENLVAAHEQHQAAERNHQVATANSALALAHLDGWRQADGVLRELAELAPDVGSRTQGEGWAPQDAGRFDELLAAARKLPPAPGPGR